MKAYLSYRVAILRKPFSLRNNFSTKCRSLYNHQSQWRSYFAFFFEGIVGSARIAGEIRSLAKTYADGKCAVYSVQYGGIYAGPDGGSEEESRCETDRATLKCLFYFSAKY